LHLKVHSGLLAVLPALSIAAATQEKLHRRITETVSVAGGSSLYPTRTPGRLLPRAPCKRQESSGQ